MAQWFWRRRFLNFVNVFSLFLNYLPLERGRALNLNKLESISLKDVLCQVWLKLTQWFWRGSENMKSEETDGRVDWQQADGRTDWQQATRKAHLNFQFRWAKKFMFKQGLWSMRHCNVGELIAIGNPSRLNHKSPIISILLLWTSATKTKRCSKLAS